MDIYAPIANRLGMGLVKGELEDLAFQYLEPEEYARIQREVEKSLKGSEKTIEQVRQELGEEAEGAGRRGRRSRAGVKHVYSICLQDAAAAASTWRSSTTCWRSGSSRRRPATATRRSASSTSAGVPCPGRIKDYIAMPKPNFYQSLHTTVMSEAAQPFEVQIRTREMDLIAERGDRGPLEVQGGEDSCPTPTTGGSVAPAARGLAERGLRPARSSSRP